MSASHSRLSNAATTRALGASIKERSLRGLTLRARLGERLEFPPPGPVVRDPGGEHQHDESVGGQEPGGGEVEPCGESGDEAEHDAQDE